MAGQDWMIYGANGYTGALMVEHAVARGLRPVLAGRSAMAIRSLAERHGLASRVFSLDAPAAVAEGLAGIGTILHAAGPFSSTSAPLVDACIHARTHYLDISGEVAVFEAIQKRATEAREAGIVLLPGAGFDVVPSDCLAMALHRALPEAQQLTLAISVVAVPGPGSIKTVVEGAASGGLVRRDGKLVAVPAAWKTAKIPFVREAQWAMTIPWGDVSTAHWSTGIPNIEVFMATPRAVTWIVAGSGPFTGILKNQALQNFLKNMIDKLVKGGLEQHRAAGRSWVWGRAEDAKGDRVEGNLETLETTTLTAMTSVDLANRLQRGEVPPGVTTPSLAFGQDYILGFPKTSMNIGPIITA